MDSFIDPIRQNLITEFSQLADESFGAELDAACLVARALMPELRSGQIESEVALLSAQCSSPDKPWQYLRQLGFQGNDGGGVLSGSCLNEVLSRRSGLPISLGVLLIHLARQQGHETWGVNFPGHFLVKVASTLIDPYQMVEVSEAECLSRLGPEQRRGAFARAPARLVALRMLNNLKYQFASTAAWARALDMLDYQLALAPGDGALLLERAEFWLRLGAVDAARATLEQVVSAAEDGSELMSLAQAQLDAIANQRNTLH
jgi:regulator of sirC expression with transglutaminase-like and TPR domain